MNIDVVIAQIRTLAPLFNGNVAGAAAYANGVADQAWLPLPAAYVLHLDEDADPNTSSTDLWQTIHEKIGVICVLSTTLINGVQDLSDRRGQAAAAYVDTVRAAIWRSILNWRPDWNPVQPQLNRETRGIYYLGASFPAEGAFDRARFFYQFNFGLDTTVTGADGWQQPYDDLVDVRGTITGATPSSAPVIFDVKFPPPAT